MVTGIDCSKDFLDIALTDDGRRFYNGKFSNDKDGFNKLPSHIKDRSLVAMEGTVPYYLPIAFFSVMIRYFGLGSESADYPQVRSDADVQSQNR